MALPTLPFGNTGHESTRVLFGGAALGRASQDDADRALELLRAAGINHIDTAASYGDSELRIGPWMDAHRDAFFLATKTGDRDYAGARASIERSHERLHADQLDLIQLHNLVDPEGWEQALGPDGALRAAVEAREAGRVRFIGVTGHGTQVARMHLASLERFAFDSVLLPYNYAMLQNPDYATDFDRLQDVCRERGVAVQTIKSVARRRWREGDTPHTTTWYEPFTDAADLERAVHFALARPGIFVNSASDVGILRHMIAAAERFESGPSDAEMRGAAERLAVEPLFIPGYARA